jgi:tRNA pseudouridine55 synthase
VKHILKVKKVGHCGTLDPLAEGVLLVLFGSATKQQDRLMHQDKIYTATILLGRSTDTGDVTGKAIAESALPADAQQRLPCILAGLTGKIMQVPPMYSALKYGGKKLYELARQGLTVERQPRQITIYKIELLSFETPRLSLRVHCSSGTYIRTLAEDIGALLGCGGTIEKLRRDCVGNYTLETALNYEDVRQFSAEQLLQKSISMEILELPQSLFNERGKIIEVLPLFTKEGIRGELGG